MQYLLRYVEKIIKALNKLFWTKFIIVAGFYERRIDDFNFNLSPRIPGYFIIIDEKNFEEYRPLFLNKDMNLIMERIYAYHDVCVAYIVGSNIACRTFLTNRNIYYEPEINANFDIPSDAILVYDSQTAKEYQGNSIYSSSFQHFISIAFTLGKKKLLACVLDTNKVPKRTLLKFNFKIIKTYIFIPSLGITTSWDKA